MTLAVASIATGVPPRRSYRRPGVAWLALPAMVLVAVFFLLPLLRLFARSVEGGSFEWYAKLLEEPLYVEIFRGTAGIAALTTLACLLIGYPVAFFLASAGRTARIVGFGFVMLPFWTSVLVRTYAWMVLLGRNGVINRALIDSGLIALPLPLLNTRFAVVLGMVHVMLPFMILPLYNAIQRIDPNLAQAARGLGAPGRAVFRRIYLPLSMQGIVAGVTLVFVVSLGFFITPALLGGGKVAMIAMVIESQVREFLNWSFAGALSLSLLAVTLAAFAVLNRVLGRVGRTA